MRAWYIRFLKISREKLRNLFFTSKRRRAGCLLLLFSLLFSEFPCQAAEPAPVTIAPSELHALSATLLDGESGRVLYDKEGNTRRANASTTKIMTCILALECCAEDDIVTVSEYAASMPDVQLGMEAGEQFYLRDLLHSLMLESHNDSAVAIAEHVAGSVEAFGEKMNEKARELGCENTHFITPNGLDATDDAGFHGTTSRDLAVIMAYCAWNSPKSARFLELTETSSYTFSNLNVQADHTVSAGEKSYTCNNKNAYLLQDAECITGKTGFTSDAGYCYVCAVVSQGRKYVVALLASGWPGNKNYKWEDCRRLMSYGREYYHLRCLPALSGELQEVAIKDSGDPGYSLTKQEKARPFINEHTEAVLMADWEELEIRLSYPREVTAGKKETKAIGKAEVFLSDWPVFSEDICLKLPYDRRNLSWYFYSMLRIWTREALFP